MTFYENSKMYTVQITMLQEDQRNIYNLKYVILTIYG
jgi:hypothetical protein